jgi:hypothetical protein
MTEGTEMESTTEERLTYSERLAQFREEAPRVLMYKVTIHSPRFGTRELRFRTEEDAVETVREHIVPYLRARYGDDHRDDSYWHSWEVTLWCIFPAIHDDSDYAESWESWPTHNGNAFVWGWASGQARMAHPLAKVFISMGGRDCDHARWHTVSQAPTFAEAEKVVQSMYASADGPCGWSSISRDDYERLHDDM